LHDRDIDTAQLLEVGEVLQRTLANYRDDAPGRAVVDDVGQILGDIDRDAGLSRDHHFDDAAVGDLSGLRIGGRGTPGGAGERGQSGGDERAYGDLWTIHAMSPLLASVAPAC